MKIRVEMKFGKKQPVWTSQLFSYVELSKKITGLGIWNRFGTDLGRIPPFQIFGYLGEKMNDGRHAAQERTNFNYAVVQVLMQEYL